MCIYKNRRYRCILGGETPFLLGNTSASYVILLYVHIIKQENYMFCYSRHDTIFAQTKKSHIYELNHSFGCNFSLLANNHLTNLFLCCYLWKINIFAYKIFSYALHYLSNIGVEKQGVCLFLYIKPTGLIYFKCTI